MLRWRLQQSKQTGCLTEMPMQGQKEPFTGGGAAAAAGKPPPAAQAAATVSNNLLPEQQPHHYNPCS
jgi:hypothetical protein